MELVHVVRRVHTVGCPERTEHLGRELEIDNIDYLIAVKSKLAPGHAQYDSIPLPIVRMPKHRRLHPIVKRIVRRCAVCIEAIFKKILFCHQFYWLFLGFTALLPEVGGAGGFEVAVGG